MQLLRDDPEIVGDDPGAVRWSVQRWSLAAIGEFLITFRELAMRLCCALVAGTIRCNSLLLRAASEIVERVIGHPFRARPCQHSFH
jgi:hypothetical protein